jgi:hypothetical protein
MAKRERTKKTDATAAAHDETVDDVIQFLPQRYEPRFPLADLEDYPGNPKEHDVGAIDESIQSNGWYGTITVQEWPNTPLYVVAGHGRRDTLLARGQMYAPVMFVKCDPKTARRIVLADNRTTTLGGFSLPKLASFLEEDARLGNLRGTGYDGDDVDAVMAELRAADGFGKDPSDDDDDETPATTPEQPRERFVMYPIERVIAETFTHFRAHGFPYRKLPLHVQLQELNALAATPQDKALRSSRAYSVADTYNPHRFEAAATGKTSPVDSFADDEKLKHAIKLELEGGAGVVGDKLFAALGLVRGTQACSNFRPGYAMYLYRRFGVSGGTVLDPCTGYGGRLVGWLCSRLGGRYIGVDPNEPTHNGNRRMADTLTPHLSPSCRVELHNEPYEDFVKRGGCAPLSIDFAFTSPPYFAKERYAFDDSQSWMRYKTIDAWVAGFLTPMLGGTYGALKHGARFLVNIADVNVGGKDYPLEQFTVDVGRAAGFVLDETLDFDFGSTFGKGDRPEGREPVFVFTKPGSDDVAIAS